MIDGLKPYSEYQTSPVPWLKRVPQHWRVLPVRRIGWVQGGKSLAVNAPGEMRPYLRVANVFDGFIDPRSLNTMPFTESEFRRFELKSGDVLLNEGQSLELVGRAAMYRGTPRDCAFQNSLIRVRPIERHASADFLEVLFRHAQSSGIFAAIATQTTSIAHLGVDRLADLVVAVPPIDEQRAIVRFLDYADRRIRKYIAAKRKLIALLEEQKRAIIDRAVTRGLDPNVRLKDSGVAWIGMVPEHWRVVALGRLIIIQTGFPFKSDGFTTDDADIRLLRGVNVAPGFVRWESVVRWPATSRLSFSQYELHIGDIVLGMDRPVIQGGTRVARISSDDVPSLLLQRVARIRPSSQIEASFLQLVLEGSLFSKYLAPIFTGIGVPHISPDQIKSFQICVPDRVEQVEIVKSTIQTAASMMAAASALLREINLLQEYRARLISDVVTGKLDVRYAAANVPDELDDVAGAGLLDGVDDDATEEEDES